LDVVAGKLRERMLGGESGWDGTLVESPVDQGDFPIDDAEFDM
jgi:hypothetical protein